MLAVCLYSFIVKSIAASILHAYLLPFLFVSFCMLNQVSFSWFLVISSSPFYATLDWFFLTSFASALCWDFGILVIPRFCFVSSFFLTVTRVSSSRVSLYHVGSSKRNVLGWIWDICLILIEKNFANVLIPAPLWSSVPVLQKWAI